MIPRPPKQLIVTAIALLILAACLVAYALVAYRTVSPQPRAEAPAPTAEPTPEVVSVSVCVELPEPTATPVPVALVVASTVDEPMHFEHAQADVETLARLLWSGPLTDDTSKRLMLWVVLNRVDAGLGGDSIQTVVSCTEFPFYDRRAHRSETNMAIAQEVLDAWRSEKAGLTVARMIPSEVLYIRFPHGDGDPIEVMTEIGGEAYDWRTYCRMAGVDIG